MNDGSHPAWLLVTEGFAAALVLAAAVLGVLGVVDGPVVIGLGLLVAVLGFVAVAQRRRSESKTRWVVRSGALVAVGAAAVVLGVVLGPDTARNGVMRITGGCDAFLLYGQNRYAPVNARMLVGPFREAKQIGSLAANKMAYADGWVRTESGNPTTSAPWNSNVWFHLVDDQGWVSFGGVRALPTALDETGYDPYGGEPVPVLPECEAALR